MRRRSEGGRGRASEGEMAHDGAEREAPARQMSVPAGQSPTSEEDGDGNHAPAAAMGEDVVVDQEAANRPPPMGYEGEIETPKFGSAGRVSSFNLSVDIGSPSDSPAGGLGEQIGLFPGGEEMQSQSEGQSDTTPLAQVFRGASGSVPWTAMSPPDGEVCSKCTPLPQYFVQIASHLAGRPHMHEAWKGGRGYASCHLRQKSRPVD